MRAIAVLFSLMMMMMSHPSALAKVVHPKVIAASLNPLISHVPLVPSDSTPIIIPVPSAPSIFPSAWAIPTTGWFQPLNVSAVLAHINSLRASHNAPPVLMDPTLTAFAQTWANKLGGSRTFVHSGYAAYGEDLGVVILPRTHSNTQQPVGGGFPSTAVVLASVDRWYTESTLYNFGLPGYSDATGHFTQLVWANSMYIGVGYAVWGDAMQGQAVVCMNFYPPGNILSTVAFGANVH